MNISLDNLSSIFGSSVSTGLNENDKNTNEYISLNNINTSSDSEASYYYNSLAKISTTVNILLIYYSNGQFQELSHIFTVDLYNELSVELNNIKYEKDKDYEIIRKSILLSMQGLQQSLNQYFNILVLQQNNVLLEEENSILNDRDKLNEYIETLLSERSLFPPQSFSLIAATLRPEYAEYIRLYGFPEGGVFDMDKLAEIVKILY